MPMFKSTRDIFKTPDQDEVWDYGWAHDPIYGLPPRIDWDYSRELKIEDVDIWEVIGDYGGGLGVYAAWMPYAEFYMIRRQWMDEPGWGVETYYGPGALKKVIKRMKELNLPFSLNDYWVDKNDMWLYQDPEVKTIIT